FFVSAPVPTALFTLSLHDALPIYHVYNAAVFVSRNGEMQLYRKIHLVPFGEYIPLRHSFPLFAAVASKWVPGDFEAGQYYTVFRDRKSTRLNSSHLGSSYAVFCLK